MIYFFMGYKNLQSDFQYGVKKTSCIENIMVLGGSMEKASHPPILEIKQNWCFH